MALITRISRLFKADFHAVLDQIEEPEQLLRQSIREMEDELATIEQRIRLAAHEQDLLQHRARELEESASGIEAELDLCFSSEKPDLARKLIRRKLESQRLQKQIVAKLETTDKFVSDQQGLVEDNRATLHALRQKAELFGKQSRSVSASELDIDDPSWMGRCAAISDDEVEIAFLQEQDRRQSS